MLPSLSSWLIEDSSFRDSLEAVIADTVSADLGESFLPHVMWNETPHDWSRLLLSASILAGSEKGECQDAALRIALACISSKDVSAERKDSAALILDCLANHPAIALAISRNLIKPNTRGRLPFPARIEWTYRSIENSIQLINGTVLRVNRFQREFWESVNNNQWLSVSAPTSSGKSFILSRWLGEYLLSYPLANIVYVVPTRALISQLEDDFKIYFKSHSISANVTSLPIIKSISSSGGNVLIFTQERLHFLLSAFPNFHADVLIVDEAQKIGDNQRGVLLQHVIERISSFNPNVKVLFASPMTGNPEILLEDAKFVSSKDILKRSDVTVNQNLLWVSQVHGQPRNWTVDICLPWRRIGLGNLQLNSTPSSESKRLSYVAYALGKGKPGNIVYVNGAADAEKIAVQLYDLIGKNGDVADERIDDLIELSRKAVHTQFQLANVLKRGVAFHYGNLPLLIRKEIESLFSEGVIKFLVCTSTLIEGVNMACRAIYVRGPQKGRGKPMAADDFWNLAGRAGRWGKEFQGNIICIDVSQRDLWGPQGPPEHRAIYQIRRTTDSVLSDTEALVSFIRSGAPIGSAEKRPELEYVFSYLASLHVRYGTILRSPWAQRFPQKNLEEIANAISEVVDAFPMPTTIIERNPGISPYSLISLLRYFEERNIPPEEFLPLDPSDDGAYGALIRIFGRIGNRFNTKIGRFSKYHALLALTVIKWMRGYPLSRIVSGRIQHLEKRGKDIDIAKAIREVLKEVEEIARFEAPRCLSAYMDVLRFYCERIARNDLVQRLPDLNLLLELGVAQTTQISLVGIGLSRTSAVALSELISSDELSETEVLRWIDENRPIWIASSLPSLVKKEIEQALNMNSQRLD